MTVAKSGLIGFIVGPEQGFPQGVHFSQTDVERIRRAFAATSHTRLELRGKKAISLRDAVRLQFGRKGLPEFIRAVLSGRLLPIGQDESVPGILGYLFRLKHVAKCRQAKPDDVIPPESFDRGVRSHASLAWL